MMMMMMMMMRKQLMQEKQGEKMYKQLIAIYILLLFLFRADSCIPSSILNVSLFISPPIFLGPFSFKLNSY